MEAQCVVDSPLSAKVALFNQQVNSHKQKQAVNPFSNGNCTGKMPRPQFSKDEYGRPAKGTLSASRSFKATIQICKDMLECCEVINKYGEPLFSHSEKNDSRTVITFGTLFTLYTVISDKVVGLLLRARKHKLVDFEGEVLFQNDLEDILDELPLRARGMLEWFHHDGAPPHNKQTRRDDNVPIILLKPIGEIRTILNQMMDTAREGLRQNEEIAENGSHWT